MAGRGIRSLQRDLAQIDKDAIASNKLQQRAATLAEKATLAQTNVLTVAKKATEDYAKVKAKAAADEAKFAGEVTKSRAALIAGQAAVNAAAPSAKAVKDVDRAAVQLSKDQLALTVAQATADRGAVVAKKALINSVADYSEKLIVQERLVKRAIEDAGIQSRKTAYIVSNLPEGTAGDIKRDIALLAEARALEKVNDLTANVAKTRAQYNQTLIAGGKAIALEEEALANSVVAASAKILQSKQGLATAIAASNNSTLANRSAAIEKEYVLASQLATREAGLLRTRATNQQTLAAEGARGIGLIGTALQQADRATKAAASAWNEFTDSIARMPALAKRGLIAVGIAVAATTALVVKLGFGYNMSREAAEKAFTGILKDAPAASAFIEELYGWTRKTSLGFDVAVHSAQEFLARGFKLKDVIPTMEIIANQAASLPRPMEESMQRISYAIGQISQSAKLHSQDIRQLTEAGVKAWEYLSQATGASIDEMQEDALKFGLNGPRVAAIILAGMKKDSANMLQLQNETGRGQVAIASRNFQELSGIFTKSIYDQFVKGLKEINSVMGSPSARAAAKEFGEALFFAFTVAISPLTILIAAVKELKSAVESLPDIPGLPEGSTSKAIGKSLLNQIPVIGPTVNAYKGARAFADTGLVGGNLEDKIKGLLKPMTDASKVAQEMADKLAAANVENAGNWKGIIADAEKGAKEIRTQLQDALKVSVTKESLQFDLAMNNFNRGPEGTLAVQGLQKDLDDLSKSASAAADAVQEQARAVDKDIDSLQRNYAARDRGEARREILDRSRASASDRATASLEAWDRALQRSALQDQLKGKLSPADKFEKQLQDADRKEQRADLQQAINEADDAKSKADATKALQRFDLAQANADKLEKLRAVEDKKKIADDLKRMDKEDAITRMKAAEEKKKNAKDLQKFDRDAAEQDKLQALQDKRDKIISDGDIDQKRYELLKQGVQDQLDVIEANKLALTTERDMRVADIERAKIIAQLADESLPKEADLIITLDGIAKQFAIFYGKIATINQKMADLEIEKANAVTGAERQLLDSFGGSHAKGGRVDPNHWYWVGERGREPFVPDTAGTVYPHGSQPGGNTTNSRSIVNLAPVHVYMNGQQNTKDALDIMFQGF